MKTIIAVPIIALLLASCVISLAQMNADNPVSATDKNAPLDATGQLISAARSGDLETITLLLKNGADVNAKDNAGYTVLMWAAESRAARPDRQGLRTSGDSRRRRGQPRIPARDVRRSLKSRARESQAAVGRLLRAGYNGNN